MKARWLALAAVLLCGCREKQPEVRMDSGREIYLKNCAMCHGVNREGVLNFPTVARSQWVDGPPERLAAIIMDGMRGNGVMPGWGQQLDDAQIAALMTWMRQEDGKPPVTPVEVDHARSETQARNTFWTVEELRALRLR